MADELETSLRISELRRRAGVTQEELAERAGVSIHTVQKVEQDISASVRLQTLHRLARALHVTTGELFTPPSGRELMHPAKQPENIDLFALRRAVEPAPELPEQPVPTRILAATTTEAERLYDLDAYEGLAELLPELIVNAELAMATQQGEQRRQAGHILLRTLHRAVCMAIQLHNVDVAESIHSRMQVVADELGDPVMAAFSVMSACWLGVRQGRFQDVQRIAFAAAESIEPSLSSTRDVVQIAVWANLMAQASGAAGRNNEPDIAEDAARRAHSAAVLIPDGTYFGIFFGPGKVAARRVENAVLADNYGRAATMLKQVPSDMRERKARERHLLDVANIRAELRQYDEALATLVRLRDLSPRWLRLQTYAAEITLKLLRARKRVVPGDLRELADFMSVDA